MSHPLHKFNVRVYGLWLRDQREVLVSDEIVWGRKITKFPGGGLVFGEGPADAVQREWREELDVSINILRQFYFTDFCVPSFMQDGSQVLSLYFEVEPTEPPPVTFARKPFDFAEEQEGAESFRFIPLDQIQPDQFTFPIDQHVARMLRTKAWHPYV